MAGKKTDSSFDKLGFDDSDRQHEGLASMFLNTFGKASTKADQVSLTETFQFIGMGGKVEEAIRLLNELADQPPSSAPEKWDPNSGTAPAIAVQNIYGPWLERGRFHQGALHSLDEPLYIAYHSRLRTKKLPPREREAVEYLEQNMPTLKEYNSRLLQGGIGPHSMSAHRLRSLRSKRNAKDKSKSLAKPNATP